jgi:predicted RNA-binding Zn-ribbon protein involved in translation (DUF1610 family)
VAGWLYRGARWENSASGKVAIDMKTNETFTCPVCGSSVPKNAPACPQCGADERTGWSDRTYLDGIDLGDDIDYDELVGREFPGQRPAGTVKLSWKAIVAAVLLLIALAGLLKILL